MKNNHQHTTEENDALSRLAGTLRTLACKVTLNHSYSPKTMYEKMFHLSSEEILDAAGDAHIRDACEDIAMRADFLSEFWKHVDIKRFNVDINGTPHEMCEDIINAEYELPIIFDMWASGIPIEDLMA